MKSSASFGCISQRMNSSSVGARPSCSAQACRWASRSSSGTDSSGDSSRRAAQLALGLVPEGAAVDPVRRPPRRQPPVGAEEHVLEIPGGAAEEGQQLLPVLGVQRVDVLALLLDERRQQPDQVRDAGVPALLGVAVHEPAAGDPGDLRAGRHVEVAHDAVVERHHREDAGHQVQEVALLGLLERTGERAARHAVPRHRVVEALERGLGPVVGADPLARLAHGGLRLGAHRGAPGCRTPRGRPAPRGSASARRSARASPPRRRGSSRRPWPPPAARASPGRR